ncbi:unnamed protein product [Echinostoma caproni]|uniref:RNA helicase n=1 Tax=Echinostoma caproni TaxID=27848 RepID=A0A183AE12_9TREM|nr:unnamed protein product [Echinostoma caproni]
MTDPEGIKTWIYSYLQSSRRIAPEYTFIQKPAGRGQMRFICEPGETGAGESTSSSAIAPAYTRSSWTANSEHPAEEVDLTADIHGGWSMENAKARLNEYLQATRQEMGKEEYTALGPDHNRSYAAELTIYAKKSRKFLCARGSGSNKQMASRACCLSLVRQLFHAGEIEAYTGEKKKKKHDEVSPTDVTVDPALERSLNQLLADLGLPPTAQPPKVVTPEQPFNMITHYNLTDFEESPKQAPQLVAWCPPQPNWNPWTGCNIDEGPYASLPLNQINAQLAEEHSHRIDHSPQLRGILKDRAELPVHVYQHSVVETVRNNRVTLIRGETGCGKTTQIPQFILDSFIESGTGADCAVLVTQPRRISAISLAERVAYERGEAVGTSVGYSVRFESILPRPYGSILFCTVGTMARKMESGLRGVSHIIVDEIHERDVNTDFMLVLLRDMIAAHSGLRLVLMSATIDTSMFVDYFGECAILDIEGRTHPVDYYFLEDCIKMLNYVPPIDDRKRKRRLDPAQELEASEENCNNICDPEYGPVVANAMREITEKEVPFDLVARLLEQIASMDIPGSVLIFLPGWNIISLLRKFLQAHPRFGSTDYLILPLHSQVPREDQRLVFRSPPPGVTKIVLSTNIAETSITINDVVFVIDFCLVRMKQFTARNNLTSYSTSWASKTNLEQRRGRAGRVRPGYAFHLCSRARFDQLKQHSTPEILRTPLHELALLIKLLRLGSVGDFLMKAMQPPPLDAVIEAEYTLKEMKALDKNDELTPLGSILARLPIEPRLGKMMVFACVFKLGCASALLASASSLGIDPFLMPPDRRRLSEGQRQFSAGYCSDHLAGLNIFQVWSAERARRGDTAADMLCERRELNGPSLRILEDAGNQIRMILLNLSFPEECLSDASIDFNVPNNPDCITLTSLLTLGLYPNICAHVEKRKMLTVEGTVALAHKGSVNCSNVAVKFAHPFFVFDEKVRTQAVSCKGLTMINPIQLMLFGCRTATWRNSDSSSPSEGIVLLDDWIPLKINFSTAANIFALRPALEALLVRACLRPEQLSDLDELDLRVIKIVRDLCGGGTGSGSDDLTTTSSPPRKRFASDFGHPLLSGRNRRVNDFGDRGFDRYVNHPQSRFGVPLDGADYGGFQGERKMANFRPYAPRGQSFNNGVRYGAPRQPYFQNSGNLGFQPNPRARFPPAWIQQQPTLPPQPNPDAWNQWNPRPYE